MDPATTAVFVVAAFASLFMAWVIGAGSSGATPFAPAVGAGAISTMRAALVVGVLGFLGAVTQGGNVSETVGRGLIEGVSLPPIGVIVILLVGAGLMSVGIRTGYPIAIAFTVTGAVVGVGLALGGDPAWAKYQVIGTVWILTPFVGGSIAYSITRVLTHPNVLEVKSIPILAGFVGAVVANLEFAFFAGKNGTLATAVGSHIPLNITAATVLVTIVVGITSAVLARREIQRDLTGGLRRFLLALGSLVAFSAGASQVGLAIGPLIPLFEPHIAVPTAGILLGGGLGILAGSWTGAPQMIKAVSREYASLGPRRSIATLVPAFLIAQVAVLIGVPVSFNEIIISCIIGSSHAVSAGEGTSHRKLALTVLAWVGSLALSFVLGYSILSLFRLT